VSTYGALARALGDIRASRAVGMMLHVNPHQDAPCYRVVHSDGRIGGFGGGLPKKIRLLEADGIAVVDGKVDLKRFLFNDFDTTFPLKQLREEQHRLKRRVSTVGTPKPQTIAGCDVSYGRYGYGALVLFNSDGSIRSGKTVRKPIKFPYIPTYLAYAELPILRELFDDVRPDVLLVDGNGILHPRGFGLASHIGVVLDIPTIGIAKRQLCGREQNGYVFLDGVRVARRLGKLYVSPGHRIDLASACDIVCRFKKFSLPEPVRQAHILANKERRKHESQSKNL
jgi:deoxyribonuclease V